MSTEPPIESHCTRCLRPAPADDDRSIEALEWESLVNDDHEMIGTVCPDCITPEEQQAMDDDTMMVTARDEQILELHDGGKSDRAVAREVGCSPNTVRRIVATWRGQ